MKRLVVLLLALVLLFSGCSASPVKTPLQPSDIDAIPVATEAMTEEELRQIVLDFFRLQLTFQWTPAENFAYSIVTYKEPRSFSKNTVYAGLPYQGSSQAGNLYWMMEYYDPKTGILDNSGMDGQSFSQLLGNHCTSSPFWAWARVVNSTTRYTNACMTKSHGFLPVGDYEYDTVQWSETSQTKAVCKANGEQRMFEAYAQLKPADGIFLYYSAGGSSHCRMVSSYPEVVRNEDGTINGDESYLLFMDQGSGLKDYTAADGSTVQLQGKVDVKATFAELFSKSYITFTFAEFTGEDPVEAAEVTLDLPEKATVGELAMKGTIRANYAIAYTAATLTDAKGNIVLEEKKHSAGIDQYEMILGQFLDLSEVRALLEKGELKLKVQVQVSTGQLITAYEGIIVEGQ